MPTELTISRKKLALCLVGSLVFFALALLMSRDAEVPAWKSWTCLICSGFCAAVFASQIIRPLRLALDGEGLTLVGGLFRPRQRILWRDVEGFSVFRMPRGGQMISVTYKPHAQPAVDAGINQPFGSGGNLPAGWTKPPEEVVAELNAYRQWAEAGRR